MSPEDFSRWLRQAGMTISTTGSPSIAIELVSGHMRDFMELLSVVREDERERCAKMCEEVGAHYATTSEDYAKAIRAMKDEVTG